MNIHLTLATRYLLGRKLRTFLTTLAIVFGVLVIFGMNTILPAMTQAFQANLLAAAGQVDATISLKTSDAFPIGVADKVAGVEGVRVVSGLLNRTVNFPTDYYDNDPTMPDQITAISLVGIDPAQATALRSYPVKDGRFLQAADTAVVVISKSLAEAIGVELGEDLSLPTASGEVKLMIVGILPARLLPGNEQVLVTLSQAQAMLGMPGKINTIEANFDSAQAARREQILAALQSALSDDYQLGALASNSELLSNLQLAQAILNVLGGLALLMGGFIIFNTFRAILAERRRDIGMLRAVGASRGAILGVILAEGLVQGVVGTAVGIVVGYLLGAMLLTLINPFLRQFLNIQMGGPVVSPGLVIGSIVMGVGVTLLAGLLPAMNASRVAPMEALRPAVGALSFKRMAGRGFWIGVAMIAIAVAALVTQNVGFIGLGGILFVIGLVLAAPALVNPIAIIFGKLLTLLFARQGTAQLAEGNLSRQPTRAAVTASATMIGLAILVMVASILTSASLGFFRVLRKSLGSDYVLIPPSIAVWGTNVGAGLSLADELRAMDGVETVSTMRFAPTQVKDVAISLLGIDPVNYPKVSGLNFSRGDEATAYEALAKGRQMIVSPVLASVAGIKVGDNVELLTPNGRQTYYVVAQAGDYLNSKIATAYISHANIEADFGRTEDVLLQVNLASGADRAMVEGAIKTALKPYPQFRLIAGKEFIDENMQLFSISFSSLYALLIFLAIPSLIAMVNTLAIGVIERTREIGMLRAVGATRRQVRTIILAEAIILAAIGTAFGLLSGLYLGYMGAEAMHAAGFPMEYAFPAEGVIVTIAAGLLFGALAAVIPARQAARLEIVAALHYE